MALKFAKGFAAAVALKVAAKHGTNAGAKAAKQTFDYAMHKSAQFSTLLHENPQLFTRFLHKQLTDDFAQFGGQHSGLHAKRFAVAEALAQKGVSEVEILARTGWFRGLDSQWKFQLDLRGGAAYKLKEGTYYLSQLFKQDSLYAAYPFLKKVRVEIARLPENVQGSFEPTTGIITLNSANNKLDFTKSLAHELQHIIQKYEGFAQGTTPSNKNYWTSAGEVEARATFKGGEDNPIRRLESEKAEGEMIAAYQKSGTYQNELQHSLASKAQRRLEKIDVSKLNAEQREILSVFKGEKDQAILHGKDINDLYSLESGSRKKGAKKILIKHYGVEKTGGLHDDELLGMMKIVRDGDIRADSFSEGKDFIRYAYELEQGDVRLKLVVDEFNDGKKIFDLYSDRNFVDYASVHSPKLPNRQGNDSAKDINDSLNMQHSQKLENAYLHKDTRKIDTEALDRHAVALPKALSEHEFMAQAKTDSRGIARVKTPIGEVSVHMKNAWDHINKGNTYKQDRKEYSGALFSTLQDPLFVIKQQYTRSISSHPLQKREQGLGNSTSAGSITQDSYVFFKPYKDSSGSRYMAAFFIGKNGELLHKTFFDPNATKIQRWIQSRDDDLLYYKYDNQSNKAYSIAGQMAQTPEKQKLEKRIAEYNNKINTLERKINSAGDVARKNRDKNIAEQERYRDLLFQAEKEYYHIPDKETSKMDFFQSLSERQKADFLNDLERLTHKSDVDLAGIHDVIAQVDFWKGKYRDFADDAQHHTQGAQRKMILLKELARLPIESQRELAEKWNVQEMRASIEKTFNAQPLKEFGTNYAEYMRDGEGAIHKLLGEKQGQVSGAFYREDLQKQSGNGNIDLVWGEITDASKHKGYGLAHILDKHPDFDVHLIPKIVEKGEMVNQNGVYTIWHKQDDKYYKVGISKGFNGERENQWIVTAYEVSREKDKTFGDAFFTDKRPLSNSTPNPTTQPVKDSLENNLQLSLKSPIENLKSAQGRINGLVAFAKYLAHPPAHLRGDAQRLRADVSAMRELDTHMRKAEADKANAIDALAYQNGYPEPQYSMKNPRQKQKFAEDSVGILQQIRSKSREGMEKIMRNSWVNSALGTRIYGENFSEYRQMKDVFDKDIAQNSSRALDLHNKLKLLSEDAQRKMHHYMVGDTNGENLSSELKALADSFRKEVRKETDELVQLGLLDKKTAEKWGDVYLLREYATRIVDKLKRSVKGLASEDYGIGLDTIHMRGKKQKVSEQKYREMLAKGEIGDVTKGKWEVLQKPSKHEPHYVLRRDYTRSEREKMGELDLISYSLPRTLAKIANQKRIATLFDAISKDSDVAQKLEAGAEIPSGFRRLNGEQYGALSIIEGKAKPENPIETLSKNAEMFFGTDTPFMQQMKEGFTSDINKKWWIVPRGQHSVVEYAKEIDPSLVSFESADVGSWYADVQGIVHKVALKKQDMLMIEHYASNEIPPAKTWLFYKDNLTLTRLMQAYNGEVLLIDTRNKDNTRTILAKNKDTIVKTTIDENGNTTTHEEAGKNIELFSKFLQESEGIETAGETNLKSTFQLLSDKEIREIVSQWDLENPRAQDKIIIEKVSDKESAQLQNEFGFKNKKQLVREIDAQHLRHAISRHGDEINGANISINIDDILEAYPKITKDFDKRAMTNNSIIYAKQINGHFVAIEEALVGQDKLRFVTAWKTRGKLNEEVLFKNVKAFPNEQDVHKAASDKRNLELSQGGTSHNQSLDNTDSTPPPIKDSLENGDMDKPTPQTPSAREGENVWRSARERENVWRSARERENVGAESSAHSSAPSVAPPKNHADSVGENAAAKEQANTANQVPQTTNNVALPDYAVGVEVASELASRSGKQRLADNLEALRTLSRLENGEALDKEAQEALGKYSGFGGTDYERAQGELREILQSFPNRGDEVFGELLFNQIITTTKNAYYTPHEVIGAIYAQLGFVSGRVLEPSMGIGNFFAAMPESLRHNTQRVGIELDCVSAKIAQYLHPNARVENMNFAEFSDSLGFDLIIGNPPYEGKMNGMPIAAAFVKKSLELAKENGIVVQVVSNAFLDNPASAYARAQIAKEAELLGAVRLPSDTFSGTSVATDIVVFQKRAGGGSDVFVGTGNHSDGTQSLSLNNYYLQHPEHVLGELHVRDTNYAGKRWSVENNQSIERLPSVLESIFKNRFGSSDAIIENATQNDLRRYTDDARTGSLVSVGDSVFVVSAGDRFTRALDSIDWLEKIQSKGKSFESLSEAGKKKRTEDAKRAENMAKDYIALRDSLERLRKAEMSEESLERIEELREQLKECYDYFRNKHCNGGKISTNRIFNAAFNDEPSYWLVRDLDLRGEHKILRQRVGTPIEIPTRAENLQDAIAISKTYAGKIDGEFLETLLEDSQALRKAYNEGELFNVNGEILSKEEYLSGDLGAKIDALQSRAELSLHEQNALKLLKEALPKPLSIDEFHYAPHSKWIPQHIMQDFLASFDDVPSRHAERVSFQHTDLTGWQIQKSFPEKLNAFRAATEHMQHEGYAVLESLLHNKPLPYKRTIAGIPYTFHEQYIANQQARDKLLQYFYDYMRTHHQKELEDAYNKQFSRILPRKVSAGHFLPPDSNIEFFTHQKEALAFAMGTKNVLLDQSVGAGKTFEMIAMGAAFKRTGMAKRPAYAVPNHLVEQWAQSYHQLYPNANVITIPTEGKQRKEILAQIANGDMDIDAIIIPHSTLNQINTSATFRLKILRDELKEIEAAENTYRTQTQNPSKTQLNKLENKKKAVFDKMKALRKQEGKHNEESAVFFDDLKIDALFVDEAHLYKNIGFVSSDQTLRGLGSTDSSEKARNLLSIVRQLQSRDGHVVFATGTPLVNSVSEVYAWQKYLDPEFLAKNNLKTYDDWLDTFGRIESKFERTPVGTYKEVRRLRGISNLDALSKSYAQFCFFTDVSKTHIKRPQVERVSIEIDCSEEQKAYMQKCLSRYEALQRGDKLEGLENDNYLSITNDGINCALDYRLIDKNAPDFAGSKINRAVEQAVKLYKKTANVRGTQLVFLDRGTPKTSKRAHKEISEAFKKYWEADESKEIALYEELEKLADKHGFGSVESMRASLDNNAFSLYQDMRAKLIKAGVKEDEIAFIHDYTSDEAKAKLFEQVRNGDVRFLIGSTKKMGAGMNVQDRIVGLHHIDAAWNPADLEQRDGRGLRQGNIFMNDPNFRLKIFYYLTKNSTDAIYYAKLEQKQASIQNFRSGHALERSVDEQIEFNYAEFAAAISGDAREIKKAQYQRKLAELEAEHRGLSGRASNETKEKEMLLSSTRALPKTIEHIKADIEAAKKKGKRELGEKELEKLKNIEIKASNSEPLFVLDDYEVFLEHNNIGNSYRLCAVSENGHEILLRGWNQNMINSIPYYARELLKQTTEESLNKQLEANTITLAQKQARLKSLQESDFSTRLAELDNEIKETRENLDSLIKEMAEGQIQTANGDISTSPNTTNGGAVSTAHRSATEVAPPNEMPHLTTYQQQLLQKELAEFGALIKDDSNINPQKIAITDLESLATFLNGWRNVDEPISTEDLLNPKRLRELMFEINDKSFRNLLNNLETISLSVDPRMDKNGTWKMLKQSVPYYQNDREFITKSKLNYNDGLKIIQENRTKIEQDLHINPIQEFGTNYAEFYHDGVGAIKKLIAESKDYQARKKAKELTKEEQENNAFRGQVAGAFYREELGDIDLVWGDSNFGLQHILERRTADFGEQKALDIIHEIPNLIEHGKIYRESNNKIELITDKYTLVLGLRDDKKFIVTALRDSRNKKRLETTQTGVADSLTGETLEKNPLSPSQTISDSTPQNIKNSLENGETHESLQQQLKKLERELATNRERIDKAMPEDKPKLREIHRELLDKKKQIKAELGDKANATKDATPLAQQIQDTFKFSPQKAKDLAQWHKESHPITKDEQGLPKVFYRLVQENSFTGRKVELDEFGRNTLIKDIPTDTQGSAYGIAFYANKDDIKPAHRNFSKLYEVFLNIKKPLDLDTIITKENMAEYEQLFKRNNEPKHLRANIAEFENKPLITYLIRKGFEQYPDLLMRKNEKGVHGELDFNNLADFLSLKGYDSATKTIVGEGKIIYVFNPNQIKSIENRGTFDSSNNIYQSSPHAGSGIVIGSIAGIQTDEQGNISFSPEKFVLGFLAGAAGSKAISSALQHLKNNPEHKKQAIDIIAQSLAQNVPDTIKKYPLLELVLPRKMSTSAQGLQAQTQTMINKLEQKEKRGLFNVVYNNKNATKIYKDLERIDEAIVLERGFENKKHKGYGAQHILKHTQDEQAEGYVTKYEIVNLGKNVRTFLKDNEPFIDSNGARIYEWQDKEGVRFRLVVGDMGKAPTTTDRMPNALALPEHIITFYSDRNLKNPMQFKNPALRGAK